jgi:hypothetical protein
MPETDILNPTAIWESDIEDSMCPNYGFDNKRPDTRLHTKAMGSTPWSRETQNTGHIFQLSWLGRSWACVQRLRQYYEQYEDGFFTIIDHDGGGRNYVGRFTSEIVSTEKGNGTYDVQGVTFEEMPIVPMVTYPSDWDHESMLFTAFNDFGDQKLATSGAWTQAALSAAPQITLGGILRTALTKTVMTDPGTAGDWATFEYRGYGFKLWLATGPAYGQADLYLDGVKLATIDCYAAAYQGATMVYAQQNTSLDIHDVKLICDGTKNASATATTISWYGLQVMR